MTVGIAPAVFFCDWIDSFVAAQVLLGNTEAIYSYDLDFDKISQLERIEP